MELTRRSFIIRSSAVTSSLAFPSLFIASTKNLPQRVAEFKTLSYEQVQKLDKYLISSLIPGLLFSILLAYTQELYALLSSLLIVLISLIILL
tara:strand:- start:1509 stop:1787 length:279 start_codon:yes stop_codon:yes gene_type:complete